jgi:hypothetical protein
LAKVFESNDSDLLFTKQHHIQRLYLRLFDVTVNTACYKKRYDTLSAEALASLRTSCDNWRQ